MNVWLQAGLFLIPNTAVKSKSIVEFLHHKYFTYSNRNMKTINIRLLLTWVLHFRILFNSTHWHSDLFNKIGFANQQICCTRISSNLHLILNWLWVGFKIISA